MLLLRTALVLCLAAAVASGQSASAEPSKAAKKEAFRLYADSEKSYREGRFEDAATLLRRAYELDPAPTLLFNLARALESGGDLSGAVDSYKKYLAADPKAKDRLAIEKRLVTLEQQVKERDELARIKEAATRGPNAQPVPKINESVPSTAVVQQNPSASRELHPAPFVLLGVGAAGVLSGGALGILASGKHSDARDESDFPAAQNLENSAHSLATGANVAYVAGGAMLSAGLVWLVIELTD